MNAYTSLAASYDRLTNDVPYPQILEFLEALLQAENKHPESVLDLACGTGSLSVLLAKKGYRVIAADMSEDMLTEAQSKADELEENRPFFICQRMERLRLPEPVDCAVCCLDSLNYITDPAACKKAIGRVWRALAPGGIFLPLLVLGAVASGAYAQVMTDCCGLMPIYIGTFVMMGMTGLFSAIVRSPLTGIILLTEMGGDYANFLALSLVAFTSYVVADLLRGRPIYDQLLDRMLAGSNPEKKKDSAAAKGRTS